MVDKNKRAGGIVARVMSVSGPYDTAEEALAAESDEALAARFYRRLSDRVGFSERPEALADWVYGNIQSAQLGVADLKGETDE